MRCASHLMVLWLRTKWIRAHRGREGCRAQHGCYRGINLLGWERGMFLLGGWLSLQYCQEEVAGSIIDTGGLGRQWVRQVCTFVCLGWRLALGLISCEACCCSVTQSCLTLCDPKDCSTPGFSVLRHLPEFAQTHVHWANDAFQPSHPLSSPSPPASNLSRDQGLFQWVSSLHQVARVLELQLQHQSFQWTPRTDLL